MVDARIVGDMTNPAIDLTIPGLAERIPDEDAAYRTLEDLRWPNGPVCPHCGSVKPPYFLNPQGEGRKTRTGKVSQRRVWKCSEKECRKQFSVLTGTIFHGSKIPVRTWLFAVVEMCASKNGVAARELQRKYDLTPKSAWFMAHRIREAMARQAPGALVGTIIADETWIGGRSRLTHGTLAENLKGKGRPDRHTPGKTIVCTLIHRETGEARSRVVPSVTADTLGAATASQVDLDRSRLMTDEAAGHEVGLEFGGGHETVIHSAGEYVRGDVTTNPVESFFSQLKRSVDGTFHHVSPEHLDRYLAEFDFRTRPAS
jgi:transposase-like protein